MGSWTDEVPRTGAHVLSEPRLVFLGHLVDRMGVPLVVQLAAALRRRGRAIGIDVIGGGPTLATLEALAVQEQVDDLVRFTGS